MRQLQQTMYDGREVGDPSVETRLAAMEAKGAEFDVTKPLGTFTVDTLPAPDATNVGRSAIVTNLFAAPDGTMGTTDRVQCCAIGSFYFWKPRASDSGLTIPFNGNITVKPLAHPQSINLSGSNIALGVTRSLTLSIEAGWPGCTKEVMVGGVTSILGTLNILGTGLGSGVGVLAGGYRKFMLDYSSGSLSWTRLV